MGTQKQQMMKIIGALSQDQHEMEWQNVNEESWTSIFFIKSQQMLNNL
jgi:hypothetical protein